MSILKVYGAKSRAFVSCHLCPRLYAEVPRTLIASFVDTNHVKLVVRSCRKGRIKAALQAFDTSKESKQQKL